MGYEVILVFIHLDRASLNQARVSQRVSEGGHTVPEDKIISQIPKVLQKIKQALALCNQCHLLDNSRLDNPFKQIAKVRDGKVIIKVSVLPEWARNLLSD
jgi:predicted ABC-type ATPase